MTDVRPSAYLREYISHRNQQISSKIHHNPTSLNTSSKKVETFSSTAPVITNFDANSVPKIVSSLSKSDNTVESKYSDSSLEQTFEWLLREKLSRNIWNVLTQYIEIQLLSEKAVNVPGFGIFSFYYDFQDCGYIGRKVFRKPVFHLSDSFSKCFGVTFPPMKSSGSIPIQSISFSHISALAGVSRDEVQLSLKDVIRGIGESTRSDRKIFLDFGVCTFMFHGQLMSIKWNKVFLQKLEDLDSQKLQPELRGMYTARTHKEVYKNNEYQSNQDHQKDIAHIEFSNKLASLKTTPTRAKTAPAIYKQSKDSANLEAFLKSNDFNILKKSIENNHVNSAEAKNDSSELKKPTTVSSTRISAMATSTDISHSKPELYSNKSKSSEVHNSNHENVTTASKVSTLTPFSHPTPPKEPIPIKSSSPRIHKSPKVLSQSLKLKPENKKEYFDYLQRSWSDQLDYFKEKDRKEKELDKTRRLQNETEILKYIEKEKEQRLRRHNEAKTIMNENYKSAIRKKELFGNEPASYFMENRKFLFYSSKEQLANDLRKQMEEKSRKFKSERERDIEEGRRKYEETIESNKKQDILEESLKKNKQKDQLNLLDVQMKEKRKFDQLKKSQEQLELSKLNLVTIEPRDDPPELKREKAKKLFEEQSAAYFNFLQTKELTKQNLKELQRNENEKFQEQLHKEQLRKLKKMEDERRSLRDSWSQQESDKKSSRNKERSEETSQYATSLF